MSKRTRMLLISAIALVALGGVLAVLLLTGLGKPTTEPEPEEPDTSVVLLSKPEKVKVTSVSVPPIMRANSCRRLSSSKAATEV